MNAVNKTMYIPLYGKSLVSRKGIILHDPKAEEIWSHEGFDLKGKARSRWLAYYMGMRGAVIDGWVRARLAENPSAAVLHLGCGMDSRALRTALPDTVWYDVDMPDVISARRKYYTESGNYHMISSDVTELSWIDTVPESEGAVVVMEGLSMYLPQDKLTGLFAAIEAHFGTADIIADAYTSFAVKASAWSNPIKSVGAGVITGIDDPKMLETGNIRFKDSLSMTPESMVNELTGFERIFFKLMFTGKATDKIYRIYTYGC